LRWNPNTRVLLFRTVRIGHTPHSGGTCSRLNTRLTHQTSPLPGCHGVAESKWGRTQTRGGCVTAGEEFEPHRDGPNRRERSAPRWYSGKHRGEPGL